MNIDDRLASRWFVLYHGCRPSKLIPVLKNLYGNENVWWPYKTVKDKFKRPIDKSVFEGYVFIAGNPELEYGLSDIKSRSTKNVYGFLPLNMGDGPENPLRLTTDEVSRIFELESMPVPDVLPDVYPVGVGDTVRIKNGSMDSCKGTVEALGVDHCTVSMVFFKRFLQVPVPYDSLELVERAGE